MKFIIKNLLFSLPLMILVYFNGFITNISIEIFITTIFLSLTLLYSYGKITKKNEKALEFYNQFYSFFILFIITSIFVFLTFLLDFRILGILSNIFLFVWIVTFSKLFVTFNGLKYLE